MEPVKGGTLTEIPAETEKLFKAYNASLSVSGWAIRFTAPMYNEDMRGNLGEKERSATSA